MRELTIHHLPAKGRRRAQVRVGYRFEDGAQAQERQAPFAFGVTDEQRRLIQWYLEEYLLCPWGVYPRRAQEAEQLMDQLGVELFEAVFSPEIRSLYAHMADHLPETRIVVHADSPDAIALPWELLRDPDRGEFGDLARRAYAFVRSQPDLVFQPAPAPSGDGTFNILMVICRPAGPRRTCPSSRWPGRCSSCSGPTATAYASTFSARPPSSG